MIKYEWRRELDSSEIAELTDLLERAAQYDAEPEYTTIRFADVLQSISQPHAHHLIIWMLPYGTTLDEPDRPERIAGLLRLVDRGGDAAEAAIVIDPDLRSIGITTLFLERAGLDTASPEGWLGTGAHSISAWAQGNHPAAGRLADRFLIPRTRRVWKLIRSTGGTAGPGRTADLAGVFTLDLTPVSSEEFGACATVTDYRVDPGAGPEVRRQLIETAAADARDAGLTGVIMHVDSGDADWVNTCRLAGFQHDRTDVRFEVR